VARAESIVRDSDLIRQHLYLLELASGRVTELNDLASTLRTDRVTAVVWDPNGTAFYLSLGPPGGSLGDRTYRCRVEGGVPEEVPSMATILDAGPDGLLLGLENAPPIEPPAFKQRGLLGGSLPLAIWSGARMERLSHDPAIQQWSRAWLAPDGQTVVVAVRAQGKANDSFQALEVLGRVDSGPSWKPLRLVRLSASEDIPLQGVGFACGPTTFFAQADLKQPQEPFDAGSWLVRVDTASGRYSLVTQLPGDSATRALAVAGG